MGYSGKFVIKNKEKYLGDHTNIVYRSLWELGVMKWMDINPDVIHWNSEEIVVPYICGTDGKKHRYFIDFYVMYRSGKIVLVEVKPEYQTIPPKPIKNPKKPTRRYLKEAMTYTKNTSKWDYAHNYAHNHGWEFQIWTEKTLESMGINIVKRRQKRNFRRKKSGK